MTTPEEDEAWRLIVDHYDETAVRDPKHPAEAEDSSGPDSSAPTIADPTPAEPADAELPAADPPGVDLPTPAFPVEEPPEAPAPEPEVDEDRFVPPPLPAAPVVPRGRRFAWAAVLGVPMLFFLAALTGRVIPGTLAALLAVSLVGAFVYLVATLPREPRDPWDDGSRV